MELVPPIGKKLSVLQRIKMKHICIRNLPVFKKGCPRNTDCPCWTTMEFKAKDGTVEAKSMCLDLAMLHYTRSLLARMEGNQQATESFRNEVVKRHDAETKLHLAHQQVHGSPFGPKLPYNRPRSNGNRSECRPQIPGSATR